MKSKILYLPTLLLTLAIHAQTPAPNWQTKAIEKYPELTVQDSPLNKRFVEQVTERRKSNPAFFKDTKWPLILADELAQPAESPESKAPIQPRQAAQAPEPQRPAEPEAKIVGHAIGAPLKQLIEVYGEPESKEQLYLYPSTSILKTFVDKPPPNDDPLWIMPEVFAVRFKPKKGITVLAYIRKDTCAEINYTWTATSIGDPSTLRYDGLTTIVEGLKELNKGQSSWSRRFGLSDLLGSVPYERTTKFFDYISGLKTMRDDLTVGLHDPFSDANSASVRFWLLSWREYLAEFDRQAFAKKEALQKKRGADFIKGL